MQRRALLASLALPLLPGCATPLPPFQSATTTTAARALLEESAAAHGLAAWRRLDDISLSYSGEWRPVVPSLQPTLVDRGFRGQSEERLLLREGRVAQAHTGPSGRKQVARRTQDGTQGEVRVWFNGEESQDADRRAAAALVADGYSLFLFGPMWLASVQQGLAMERAGTEQIDEHECDVLRVRLAPGLGLSDGDQLALFIDRKERLMRRVRFTLEGLESTRGAVAEVSAFDHITLHGVRWPTRFHERLLRPLPLPVHDWRSYLARGR